MDLAARTTARKFLEWQPCHPRNSTIPPRSSAKSNITGRAKSGHWVLRWLRFVGCASRREIEIGLSCSSANRGQGRICSIVIGISITIFRIVSSNSTNRISTRYFSEIYWILLISSLLDVTFYVLCSFYLILKFCCVEFEDDYIYIFKEVSDHVM